jgi:hypothetical protein
MFLRLISQFSLGVSLLTATMLTYAVTCPPIETIQKAAKKMDTNTLLSNGYFVKSSRPVFEANGLNWFVGVDGINANSSAKAILIAKEKVQQVHVSLYDVAIYLGKGGFRCSYRPGNIIVVGMN